MPEGHSLRRLALAFDEWFVGQECETSSPQGRFAQGAARLDGLTMVEAASVGKHLFLRFEDAEGSAPLWLHVHLGLYGSWRFYGSPTVKVPASIGAPRLPDLRLAGEGGFGVTSRNGDVPSVDATDAGDDAFSMFRAAASVGPRENEGIRLAADMHEDEAGSSNGWSPPSPRGAVRLRILTDNAAADLTGPTQCEVLDAGGVEEVLARLGPDPLDDDSDPSALRAEFVKRVRASKRPIGELVMDQSIAAGVGNIFRAEALFRQGISPFRRGSNVSPVRLRKLWDDFVLMLGDGVVQGRIRTVMPERISEEVITADPEAQKWFVYKRAGQPCQVCGAPVRTRVVQGRNLFWCSSCQR